MSVTDLSSYRGLFIETANNHIKSINSLIINNNNEAEAIAEIHRRLHSLKGSSSVMGYKEIAALCDNAVSENDTGKLEEIVSEIEKLIPNT